MKVLMISRATLYSSPGGDTIQIIETASYLRKLGVEVDIALSDGVIVMKKYDLLHFFNIIRPADILPFIKNTKVPFVVSTIFVDYSEADRKASGGIKKIIAKFINPDLLEYLKAMARAVLNGEKIGDWLYILRGHAASIRYIIKRSHTLLPNSESEYQRLVARYGLTHNHVVVPNAVNLNRFSYVESERRNLILCVGRIEYRKNQLNLIRALKGSNYELFIVGKASPNHKNYYEQCKAEAGGNVTFIDHIDQQELSKLFNKTKVHVLASWFETTGLSSLEAAVSGCNIVVTKKGDTEEYFRDYAFYCEPDIIESIRGAIDRAFNASFNVEFLKLIEREYIWEKTALVTKQAYEGVLLNQKKYE